MGFCGIQEDKHLAHVPGTVILNEQDARSGSLTAGLKHGTGKDSHIVLAPQPSEDPNDPLNVRMTFFIKAGVLRLHRQSPQLLHQLSIALIFSH